MVSKFTEKAKARLSTSIDVPYYLTGITIWLADEKIRFDQREVIDLSKRRRFYRILFFSFFLLVFIFRLLSFGLQGSESRCNILSAAKGSRWVAMETVHVTFQRYEKINKYTLIKSNPWAASTFFVFVSKAKSHEVLSFSSKVWQFC